MTVSALERRRRRAASSWRRLTQSPEPVIYVGMGSCGLAAGAADALEGVTEYLDQHAVPAKVVKVGCIGPCYLEPLVDFQLPGKPRLSYANMSSELAARTLDSLLAGGVPKAHLVGHFGESDLEGVPRFWDHPMLARQFRIVLRNCGIIDPEQVDHYLARGGYRGIETCLGMRLRRSLKA